MRWAKSPLKEKYACTVLAHETGCHTVSVPGPTSAVLRHSSVTATGPGTSQVPVRPSAASRVSICATAALSAVSTGAEREAPATSGAEGGVCRHDAYFVRPRKAHHTTVTASISTIPWARRRTRSMLQIPTLLPSDGRWAMGNGRYES